MQVTTAARSAWTHGIPRRKQRILLYIYFKNYLVVLYIDVGCLCYFTFPLHSFILLPLLVKLFFSIPLPPTLCAALFAAHSV